MRLLGPPVITNLGTVCRDCRRAGAAPLVSIEGPHQTGQRAAGRAGGNLHRTEPTEPPEPELICSVLEECRSSDAFAVVLLPSE